MSESADIRGLALKVLETSGGVFSRIKKDAGIGEKSIRITGLNMPANDECFMAAVEILRENGYSVDFNIPNSKNEIASINISWGNASADRTTKPKDSGRGWLSKLEHIRKGL
jgi:hypothetical protein